VFLPTLSNLVDKTSSSVESIMISELSMQSYAFNIIVTLPSLIGRQAAADSHPAAVGDQDEF